MRQALFTLIVLLVTVLSACADEPVEATELQQVDPSPSVRTTAAEPLEEPEASQAADDCPVCPAPVTCAAAEVPLPPPIPAGFGEEDRFSNLEDACKTLSEELAPEEHRKSVRKYCLHRAFHSSRNATAEDHFESRVDGSWIHDRDRPAAWAMWKRAVKHGRQRPETCVYDRVDMEAVRPPAALKLAYNWPFTHPEMTPEMRRRWLKRPHDVEKHGTRGPIDNHVGSARRFIPGCWDPAALDRFDVAATVTILHSLAVCDAYGCRTKWKIKEHWNDRI